MMILKMFASFTVGFALIGITYGVEAKDLIIFGSGRPIAINYSKCGNATADMSVKVDKDRGTINWKWEDKDQVWCGWGTESLPQNDLTAYLDGELVIKFIGSYQGNAPEVKFIDFSDTHTKLVKMSSFTSGDPETGATAKIPMKEFGMDPEFSANPKKIRTIQFDAEYNSVRGKIKITYIGLTKNK